MNRIDALQWVSHNTHSAHENELEEDVDFLAENSVDQDSQYNFVIDRFLVDEPGNDILEDDEDDEQPILFMNYSNEGKETSSFLIIKVASESNGRAKYRKNKLKKYRVVSVLLFCVLESRWEWILKKLHFSLFQHISSSFIQFDINSLVFKFIHIPTFVDT